MKSSSCSNATDICAAVITPWLGKYDTLRKIVGRYERGEISVDEGAAEIELGKHGGDRRSEKARSEQVYNVPLKKGNSAERAVARLRRDHRALYEAVQRGELSANAAAIEAGFRKKLTKFEQIMKWLPSLSPSERRQLKELL